MDWKKQLKEAGLTKSLLSQNLGLHPNTVTLWQDNPPKYARAYVDILIRYQRAKEELQRVYMKW